MSLTPRRDHLFWRLSMPQEDRTSRGFRTSRVSSRRSLASSWVPSALLAPTVALGLAASLTFPLVPIASAQDGSGLDSHFSLDANWANPDARSTDPDTGVSVLVKEITPRLAEFSGPRGHGSAVQTYSLTLRNDSDEQVDDLALTVKSAAPVGSSAEVRVSLLANSGEYPQSTEPQALPHSLEPGQSAEVTVELRLGEQSATAGDDSEGNAAGPDADLRFSLPNITAPGTFPVLFNVVGNQEQLAVARATLTAVASGNGQGGAANSEDNAPAEPANTPLTFLWPLAAETHAVAGATGNAPKANELYLSEDSLASELSEGGRLRVLLDAYRDAIEGEQGGKVRMASCIAIDPELLEVVELMTYGYRVGSEPPRQVEENKRLRDSWGDLFSSRDKSVDGEGKEAAKKWLADLRKLVDGGCSVALPYGGADIDQIAGAAQGPAAALGRDVNGSQTDGSAASLPNSTGWLGVHALGRGAGVINRILGVWPMQNVVIPSSGQLAEESLPFLAAGATRGVTTDLSKRFEAMVDGLPALPSAEHRETVTALVADNTVRIDQPATANDGEPAAETNNRLTQRVVGLTPAGDKGAFRALEFSGDLGTVLAATGSRPQTTPYSNPATRVTWAADSPAARMSAVFAVLQQELRHGNPVLALPPGEWTVNEQDARAYLGFIESAFASGEARPVSLGNAVTPRGLDADQLARGVTQHPFADPASRPAGLAPQLAEVARRELDLTLTMKNSATIALDREEFTRPLFGDLVRATTAYRSRDPQTTDAATEVANTRVRTAFATTEALLESVALLPPGNVFTRTSGSSPLIVVAQNGLPLPVPAKIRYQDVSDPRGEVNESDAQLIPAKGSITVPLTTVNTESRRSDLQLWLTTPSDRRISPTVQISVQEGLTLNKGVLFALLGGVAVIGVGGKLLLDRDRAKSRLIRLENGR